MVAFAVDIDSLMPSTFCSSAETRSGNGGSPGGAASAGGGGGTSAGGAASVASGAAGAAGAGVGAGVGAGAAAGGGGCWASAVAVENSENRANAAALVVVFMPRTVAARLLQDGGGEVKSRETRRIQYIRRDAGVAFSQSFRAASLLTASARRALSAHTV